MKRVNLPRERELVLETCDPEEFIDRLGLTTEELFDKLTDVYLDRRDRFEDVIDSGFEEYGYDYSEEDTDG